MNSRHLILIVLTGVGLIIFAPMSGNKESARVAEVADKPAATASPSAQELKVESPKVKVVRPPERSGTPQSHDE